MTLTLPDKAHLCVYTLTTYTSDLNIVTLEMSLNQDLKVLVTWFSQNYLIVNSIKTQGMVLGRHTHVPDFFIGETKVELANSLKILGVTIDGKLTYCEHISNMLKKVYAKTSKKTDGS